MLSILLLLASPQPSPTPLKTITHVYSSPFCTALRENVATSVQALIENNITFGRSKDLFLKMSRDAVYRANPQMVIEFDIQQLDPMIGSIAKTLIQSEKQLDDLKRFPEHPVTPEEAELDTIRDQLRIIAERQNEALNLLSGTFFTYTGNKLLGHGDGLPKNDGGTGTPVDDPHQVTPLVLPPIGDTSSASAPSPAASPVPALIAPEVDMGLAGMTRYARLFNGLTTYQLREQVLESNAAQTILQAAKKCAPTP